LRNVRIALQPRITYRRIFSAFPNERNKAFLSLKAFAGAFPSRNISALKTLSPKHFCHAEQLSIVYFIYSALKGGGRRRGWKCGAYPRGVVNLSITRAARVFSTRGRLLDRARVAVGPSAVLFQFSLLPSFRIYWTSSIRAPGS
jgi:hypothetical protein